MLLLCPIVLHAGSSKHLSRSDPANLSPPLKPPNQDHSPKGKSGSSQDQLAVIPPVMSGHHPRGVSKKGLSSRLRAAIARVMVSNEKYLTALRQMKARCQLGSKKPKTSKRKRRFLMFDDPDDDNEPQYATVSKPKKGSQESLQSAPDNNDEKVDPSSQDKNGKDSKSKNGTRMNKFFNFFRSKTPRNVVTEEEVVECPSSKSEEALRLIASCLLKTEQLANTGQTDPPKVASIQSDLDKSYSLMQSALREANTPSTKLEAESSAEQYNANVGVINLASKESKNLKSLRAKKVKSVWVSFTLFNLRVRSKPMFILTEKSSRFSALNGIARWTGGGRSRWIGCDLLAGSY